ncbi:piggyBac transposable element-derived protein 4-like [Leptidea sinapis]|uniref:piggyBac transposable element-derived protein 4-like n=1 Tax=Leptidea sinapis TaxID=189913 RepID=UPI0021245A42|nr:piggyBac transposable element-derived protein 4-like [Leptidea sinapis]
MQQLLSGKKFFNLVARSLVNAYILYNKSREQRRRLRFSQFLMDCGEQLVETASDAEAGPSRGPHAVGTSTRLVGRHFMERIPSSEKKDKVARVCKVCADILKKETGKRGRKETIYYCPDCNVPLCYYPCFKIFHTKKNYVT